MSFTDPDKEALRKYLGYPIEVQSLQNISNRCAAVASTSSEAVSTIQSQLRSLERTDQQIRNAIPFSAQTFSSNAGGTQQYVPGGTIKNLKAEARQIISEISAAMSLPICRDIYAPITGPSQSLRV
jgi:hypothetical protein